MTTDTHDDHGHGSGTTSNSERRKSYDIWVITIIFIISILMISFGDLTLQITGIGFFLISGIFYARDFVQIPNHPPHILLITRLGKKMWKKKDGRLIPVYLGEGLGKLRLKGILESGILISTKKEDIDFDPQKLMTPDDGEVYVSFSLSYKPDKDNLSNFINIGEHHGFRDMIQQIKDEKLRTWSGNIHEGPQTWEELKESGDIAIAILVKGICGDSMGRVHNEIPTSELIMYKTGRIPSNPKMREKWGDGNTEGEYESSEKWQLLLAKVNALPEAERTALWEAVDERIELIKKIRGGSGSWPIPHMGVLLTRANLGEILPDKENKVVQASLKLKEEERERDAENYEIQTDLSKAAALQKKIKDTSGEDVSIDACMNQIMKWKMIREGHGYVYDGSMGNIAGFADMFSSIMKGGKP
jgi:hypothetical protein